MTARAIGEAAGTFECFAGIHRLKPNPRFVAQRLIVAHAPLLQHGEPVVAHAGFWPMKPCPPVFASGSMIAPNAVGY